MTPRLLANENVPRVTILALRDAGIDIEWIADLMPAASDSDVLEYAKTNERWLVTFDRDYGELVFAHQAAIPPAIVYLRQGPYAPAWPAQAILDALERPTFVAGHLVVIRGRSMRRRALPDTREP